LVEPATKDAHFRDRISPELLENGGGREMLSGNAVRAIAIPQKYCFLILAHEFRTSADNSPSPTALLIFASDDCRWALKDER